MSDLTERLRRLVGQGGISPVDLVLLARDSADEIESLTLRLRDSLAAEEHCQKMWDKAERELSEARELLRENCGNLPMPLGWFERVRIFLATESAK